MRKIITFMFALMMVFRANAQTVVRNGVFSNMYVGISVGVIHNPISDYTNFNFSNLNYNGALEIGKNVTPITGFSLAGSVLPDFTNGFDVKAINVTGNTKFNLMNLFGRYKGYPRRVEIQTITGIGWDHNFDASERNPNDLSLNAGLEFDFNLGKNRAWYVTFTPMAVAHNIIKSNTELKHMAENADLQANLGVAYRFGSNKTGSHNFVICPNMYTEDEYQELYQQYEDCLARPVETKVDTVIVEKVVEVEKIVEGNDTNGVINFITFEKGSAKISNVQMETLNLIMNSMNKEDNIKVIGSADTKTGNEEINTKLATQRAEAVKDVLEKNGFTVAETVIKLDAFDGGEISRCAIVTKK